MDKNTLSEFNKQLVEKRAVIIKQLESIGIKSQTDDNNYNAEFPDYGDSVEDNAIEVADYSKNLSFEKDLEKELNDIDKALGKIKDGSYGKCNHCGTDIEVERLKIRPQSGSCVACKNALKGEG
ncbi:MAG TPA: hypothetical protein VJB67_01655 [Patescibacteria group bacterium]|nr:hypothetical protein [Patescibacteria group bacterium]